MNEVSDMFKNISPSKDHWVGTGTGISSVTNNFVITKSHTRVDLYISKPVKEENKYIFDELEKYKETIENVFGDKLIWERLNDKRASRIKYQKDGGNIYNESDWPVMIEFLVDSMIRLEKAFREPIMKVKKKLNH